MDRTGDGAFHHNPAQALGLAANTTGMQTDSCQIEVRPTTEARLINNSQHKVLVWRC